VITPQGWREEEFPLPPMFAPSLPYVGRENVRFAPGWSEPSQENHWTYAFVWQLEGNPDLSPNSLRTNISTYFHGLISKLSAKLETRDSNPISVQTEFGDVFTIHKNVVVQQMVISMPDFKTGMRPLRLNTLIHFFEKMQETQRLLFSISPHHFDHAVWKQFDLIRDGLINDAEVTAP